MQAWLDAIGGDFVVAVEAEKFVAAQRETHPVEFNGWLQGNAARLVTETMTRLVQSNRMKALRRASASVFADAAKRYEDGDEDAFVSIFSTDYAIDEDNTRRKFGQMVWADVEFAAKDYEDRAASNAFEAAWLRAVQKRLPKNGSKTVADVFTEDQLRALRKNN